MEGIALCISDIRRVSLWRKMLERREMTRNGDGLLPADSLLSETFYEKIGVLGHVDRGEYSEHCVERLEDLELR